MKSDELKIQPQGPPDGFLPILHISKESRSVASPASQFRETKAPTSQFGGTSRIQIRERTSSVAIEDAPRSEIFYTKKLDSDDSPNALYAYEILRILGVMAPKARISKDTHGELEIATTAIDGYIPMLALRHELKADDISNKVFLNLRERYRLDMRRQVVFDEKEQQEYKTGLNPFGVKVLIKLLGDPDFQTNGNNFGLTRVGNRFYACAIDKDKVDFASVEDPEVARNIAKLLHDPLLNSALPAQELIYVYRIWQALQVDPFSDSCAFDQAFPMPDGSGINVSLAGTFKRNAQILLNEYSKLDPDWIIKFEADERKRSEIADQVIAKLKIPNASLDYFQDLKRNIMDDLRGPYYQHFFVKNSMHFAKEKSEPQLVDLIYFNMIRELAPQQQLIAIERIFKERIQEYVKAGTRQKKVDSFLEEFDKLKMESDPNIALEKAVKLIKAIIKQEYDAHRSQFFSKPLKTTSDFANLLEQLLSDLNLKLTQPHKTPTPSASSPSEVKSSHSESTSSRRKLT